MKKICGAVQILIIGIALYGSVLGSDLHSLCDQSESLIKSAAPSLRLLDKRFFSTSCKFWWKTKKKENIEFYLYVFNNENESRQKLESDIKVAFEGLEFSKLNANDPSMIWEDSYLYTGNKSNSTITICRKSLVIIEMFTPNTELASLLEKKLRSIEFRE